MSMNYPKMKYMSLVLLILCFVLAEGSVMKGKPVPEALPPVKLPLNDLSGFRPTGANWKIVGDVSADLHTEQVMEGSSGKGVLANLSDPKNRAHLFTRFEHGDIEIRSAGETLSPLHLYRAAHGEPPFMKQGGGA